MAEQLTGVCSGPFKSETLEEKLSRLLGHAQGNLKEWTRWAETHHGVEPTDEHLGLMRDIDEAQAKIQEPSL